LEKTVAEERDLKLAELELDLENYRTGTQDTVRDAIKAMAADQGPKLGRLGADILKRGLNPLKRLMVTPLENDENRFRVLEGNRRVTAMKLIQTPALAEKTKLHTTFKRLNKQKSSLPKIIKCVILTPEEGFIWREREHNVGLNGVGTEQWSSSARMRAAADQGKKAYAHDVLELALSNPSLSAQARTKIESHKFKITNLNRLLESTEIRKELGLDTSGTQLQSSASKPWLNEVLTKVVEIIATEKNLDGKPFTVKNIYDQSAQVKFLKGVSKSASSTKSSVPVWTVGADPEAGAGGGKPKKKAKKPNPSSADRKTLIPDSSETIAATGRANDIYLELRSLKLSAYANAAAILFRVFIEFSVDHFIKKNPVGIGVDKELKKKIAAVSQFMETNSILTKKELVVINNMVGTLGELVSTVTLNSYVHSDKLFPSPQELKISWDRIEHFLVKAWA
jgi:hypothetical protein